MKETFSSNTLLNPQALQYDKTIKTNIPPTGCSKSKKKGAQKTNTKNDHSKKVFRLGKKGVQEKMKPKKNTSMRNNSTWYLFIRDLP